LYEDLISFVILNGARYFSSLFAASKNFPNYLGIASGASMSLFGLSPLFLSLLASNFFTDLESGSLNVILFLKFMAIFTGSIHVFGAFNLRTPTPTSEPDNSSINDPEVSDVDESTRLLPGKPNVRVNGEPADGYGDSSLDLLRDCYFWILAVFLLFTLGAVSQDLIFILDEDITDLLPSSVRNGDIQHWNYCVIPSSCFVHASISQSLHRNCDLEPSQTPFPIQYFISSCGGISSRLHFTGGFAFAHWRSNIPKETPL
jgi:hypothetical protein